MNRGGDASDQHGTKLQRRLDDGDHGTKTWAVREGTRDLTGDGTPDANSGTASMAVAARITSEMMLRCRIDVGKHGSGMRVARWSRRRRW